MVGGSLGVSSEILEHRLSNHPGSSFRVILSVAKDPAAVK